MRDALARAGLETSIDARVWQRRWTVHVAPIGTGDHATLYLSRYVYRVALTNRRLERFVDGRVTFQYTNARTQRSHSLTLAVDAFLDRFLQHVLPRGFTKVRWYGLLSPGRRVALERARQLLARQARPPTNASPHAPATSTSSRLDSTPVPLVVSLANRCPLCARGRWVLVQRYQPARAPPSCARAA
jgi:hypothetical protein